MLQTKVDTKKWINAVQNLEKDELPRTIAATLTETAAFSRLAAQDTIDDKFTLRNRFTKSRVRYNRAKPSTRLQNIESEIGHTEMYMKHQEDGGIKRAKKTTIPIGTNKSRIGGSSSKLTAKRYRMRQIGKIGGGQKNKNNGKFFFGNFKRKGIYTRIRGRLWMIHNLENQSVRINQKPWLKPSVNRVMKRKSLEERFAKNARKIIRQSRS
jgi:hypothetical protein